VSTANTAARRNARLAAHLFTLAALGIWFAVGALVPSYQLPGPVEVAKRAWAFFADWHEVKHMLFSFAHIISAVAISFVIGTFFALLAHYVAPTRLMVHGRLSPFLNSFSGVGWIFIAIILLGITPATVIFVMSMVLIPFSIINMREGLISLDPELDEMGNSFTRSRWRTFLLITLPSLFPFIFATIRISFGVAWKVGLTAEFFGGGRGMGYLLSLAQNDFDTALIFTVILIIVAFVFTADRYFFGLIQNRLARHRAGGGNGG
jgi:NitT/TauT family transport system permease protein